MQEISVKQITENDKSGVSSDRPRKSSDVPDFIKNIDTDLFLSVFSNR